MAVLIGAAFLLVLLIPFTLVWALNTLLGTTTAYSLQSWLASIFVILLAKVSIKYIKSE